MSHFQTHSEDGTSPAFPGVTVPQRAATSPHEDSDHHHRNHLSPRGTSSIVEALAEACSVIDRLYRPANSASNARPDHRLAHNFHNAPEPTNVHIISREDALFVPLLNIESSIRKCLELLRSLALRDDVSRPEYFTHPITASTNQATGAFYIVRGLRGEGTAISSPGQLYNPHIPGLYHKQWLQSPAISPPAYTAFCQCHPRGCSDSPSPSPASEMGPRAVGVTDSDVQAGILGDGEGREQRHYHRSTPTAPGADTMSSSTSHFTTPIGPRAARYRLRVPNIDEHHAGANQGSRAPAESPPPASRTPESTAGLPRRRSPAGGNNDDHWQPGRCAAWLDSDSESGGWIDNGPNSHLGGARSRWG